MDKGLTISVIVHAPSFWIPDVFLEVFEEDKGRHEVVSLSEGYYINGKE